MAIAGVFLSPDQKRLAEDVAFRVLAAAISRIPHHIDFENFH